MPKRTATRTGHAAGRTDADKKVFKVVIKGTIHVVWREITRTDAPIACFFNSQMYTPMLAPGSRLAMRTPDGKFTGVVGEILEVIPPTRFSHTFRFTGFDDPPCKVTYDLREVEGGTEFTLTIDELAPDTKTAKQMVQGSKLITGTLKSVIETGRPSTGVRALFVLFRVLQPFNPKKTRSEHWPVN
jgi:uncharacterized protein YndB with AHSA1/START domain